MNDKAKYLAVDEEQNNRIQHLRDVFSVVYDEIEKIVNLVEKHR